MTTSKLLAERIRSLHLRPDAPYPSETRDGHEAIAQWRREQRLRLVPTPPVIDLSDEDDGDIE